MTHRHWNWHSRTWQIGNKQQSKKIWLRRWNFHIRCNSMRRRRWAYFNKKISYINLNLNLKNTPNEINSRFALATAAVCGILLVYLVSQSVKSVSMFACQFFSESDILQELTSHYDTYATLASIIGLPPGYRGATLTKPLPTGRTCDDVGIPLQFCLCRQVVVVGVGCCCTHIMFYRPMSLPLRA